jgi:hypothetical protein
VGDKATGHPLGETFGSRVEELLVDIGHRARAREPYLNAARPGPPLPRPLVRRTEEVGVAFLVASARMSRRYRWPRFIHMAESVSGPSGLQLWIRHLVIICLILRFPLGPSRLRRVLKTGFVFKLLACIPGELVPVPRMIHVSTIRAC